MESKDLFYNPLSNFVQQLCATLCSLKKKNKLLLFLSLIFALVSCHKDPGPIDNSPTPDPSGNYTNGVFVMNEGNFQWGNAAVSFIHLNDFSIENNLYQAVNQETLGDVGQSMTINGNKAYLVVNNSQTIVVVNLVDFKTITKITGFNSPRYMLVVNNSKAYVSDLYQNAVYVVNLQNNSIQKTVAASGWTERMLLLNGKVFVCNMDKANVLVMDTASDAIIDSIPTIKEPNSIVKDAQNRLWVLCSGGSNHEQIASLMCINPTSLQIETQFSFNATDFPTELSINKEGTELFYLNSGVYKMSTTASALPTQATIAQNGRIFYRMGIHPLSNDIFVTDAVDYMQDGWVLQYDAAGNALHSWKAGRIPGFVCFRP
ncbi:MAG: DUF5074 domain-containing protein [Bacteroidota bacterium]